MRRPMESEHQQRVTPDDDANDIDPGDIHQTVYDPGQDADDVRDLADAERAVAQGGGTAEQADGVARAGRARLAGDRLAGWRERRDA
jgi:hypothetical protein